MKKNIKISMLALTMSALLFSCATPDSPDTSSSEQHEGYIETLPELSIKDLSIPADFKPTEGATPVTTEEQAKKIFEAISIDIDSINNIPDFKTSRLNAVKEKDPDLVVNSEKFNNFYDTTDNGSMTLEAKPEHYSFLDGAGILDINKYKTYVEVKIVDGLKSTDSKEDYDIKESASLPSNTGLIKSYLTKTRRSASGGVRAFGGQLNNTIDYDNESTRKIFLFDDSSDNLNGIMIFNEDRIVNYKELTPLVNKNPEIMALIGEDNLSPEKQKIVDDFMNEHMKASKKITFYDLQGNETFKYKDIKTYTEYEKDRKNK